MNDQARIAIELHKDYCCVICRDIYWNNPTMHKGCNKTFCGDCIRQAIKAGLTCPNRCSEQLIEKNLWQVPLEMKQFLEQLQVSCNLCGLYMQKRYFAEHQQNACLLKCTNNCSETEAVFYQGTIGLQMHLSNICPLDIKKCKYGSCEFTATRDQFGQHNCVYQEEDQLSNQLTWIREKIKLLEDKTVSTGPLPLKEQPNDWSPKIGEKIEYYREREGLWCQAIVTMVTVASDNKLFKIKMNEIELNTKDHIAKLGTHTNAQGNNRWRIGDEVLIMLDHQWSSATVVKRVASEHETDLWSLRVILVDSIGLLYNWKETEIRSILPAPRELDTAINWSQPVPSVNLFNESEILPHVKINQIVDAKNSKGVWYLAKLIVIYSRHECRVHFLGFLHKEDENTATNSLRKAGTMTRMLNPEELRKIRALHAAPESESADASDDSEDLEDD